MCFFRFSLYDEKDKHGFFSSKVPLCVIIEVEMSNRLKQVFVQYQYQNLDIDYEFISLYLDKEERALFDLLKKTEQNHSIFVAKSLLVLKQSEINDYFIKAGLLHDVGKSLGSLSLLEKGIYVILYKVMGDHLKRWASFDGVATYLYHGERGAEMLRRIKTFDEYPLFYEIIKTHHWDKEKIIALDNGKNILKYHLFLKKMDDQY